MSERNLPATPRRLALARRAGLVAHAPSLTTAAAWLGALIALSSLAPRLGDVLRQGLRQGLELAGRPQARGASSLAVELSVATLSAALPVVLAAAALALLAHVAQVRAVWLPRRRVEGAPAAPSGMGARARSALWSSARGCVLAVAVLAWLGSAAPRVGQVLALRDADLLPAGAALIGGATLVAVAGWVALGALELIGRALLLATSARMTAAELREELRATGAGSRRWAEERRAAGADGGSLADRQRRELAEAAILVVGDDLCAAVAWSAQRSPVPRVISARRGRGVGSLVAEARRQRVPIQRAPQLAELLVAAGPGDAPREAWPLLATLIAVSEDSQR